MLITPGQWELARDLLQTLKELTGEKFTTEDVETLAQGIARHARFDRRLNAMRQAAAGTADFN